jgi:prevent-host-death family protein
LPVLCERTDSIADSLGERRPLLDMAIINSYILPMDVSIAEAKNRLPELIRAVEGGAAVVITRHGKPVAQLTPAPVNRRQVRLGGMKDRVQLLAGWDAPVDLDGFLGGE